MAESFRQRLKRLRLKKNLTQVDLAKRAGLHVDAYANIERGVRGASLGTAIGLALALHVTLDYLVRGGRKKEREADLKKDIEEHGQEPLEVPSWGACSEHTGSQDGAGAGSLDSGSPEGAKSPQNG
jgi:transcriptional regulator with XRE-family HTH domain